MCEGKKKKLFQYAEFGNTTVFDMMLFHFHSLHAVAYVLCNVANTHTHILYEIIIHLIILSFFTPSTSC